MPSKLAEEISEGFDSTANWASLIDDDLWEIVEVLRGLRIGGCWCGVEPTDPDEVRPAVYQPHSSACDAARKLWDRLDTF